MVYSGDKDGITMHLVDHPIGKFCDYAIAETGMPQCISGRVFQDELQTRTHLRTELSAIPGAPHLDVPLGFIQFPKGLLVEDQPKAHRCSRRRFSSSMRCTSSQE